MKRQKVNWTSGVKINIHESQFNENSVNVIITLTQLPMWNIN